MSNKALQISENADNIAGTGYRPLALMTATEQRAIQDLVQNQKHREAVRAYYDKVQTNKDGYVVLKSLHNGITVNSLLRKQEWEQLDAAVVMAATKRMSGIMRYQELGLVTEINSIGVLVSQWNVASDVTEATVSVEGNTASEMDKVDYLLKGVTIPVIHKRFDISARMMAATRLSGSGVDTTNAEATARVVGESLESMLFLGSPVSLNGNPVYGLTTHPDINTGTATGDWGTIDNIYTDALRMITAASAANHFGNYEMWVANPQYLEMLEFYSDGSNSTALQRVESLPQIDAVHPSDWMTAGTVLLVQTTRDVSDIAITQTPTLVEWASPDGSMNHFKVVAIAAPRVKSDYSGKSGIVYYTGA